MNITNTQMHQRHHEMGGSLREMLLVMLLFASMGAITWAIRGTSGWGGIDGTIVPGMMWGVLWWYVCWRKGIDARGIPLWLGLGIALGGDLGYGQYVSWIRGMFRVGGGTTPIAPWIGYVWFAICGIGWAAPGGVVLGWALGGRKSLTVYLTRLVIPVGTAIAVRLTIQTWPELFFPHWKLGIYVPNAEGTFNLSDTTSTQRNMIIAWFACALLSLFAWFTSRRFVQINWITRTVAFICAGTIGVVLWYVGTWLYFPHDRLGLFSGDLDRDLERTVFTNAQNAIVVGWWIGALLVAALGRDRSTLFSGGVIGAGFGVGFPLAAVWCLGYSYAPNLVDWWKMWELQSGFHLGLLYVVVLYWAIRQVNHPPKAKTTDHEFSTYRQWCETGAMALGAFLSIYLMAWEHFRTFGLLLGLTYVVSLFLATRSKDAVEDRRKGVSFVFSLFLLVFILAFGVSAQEGILFGLYDPKAVDQYRWPWGRVILFAPMGILICGAALLAIQRAIWKPHSSQPQSFDSACVNARMIDLMTFTGVVGAASIWPEKIGVLYAAFLCLALFAFSRLNCLYNDIHRATQQM